MKAIEFPQVNNTLAKDQPEYLPLPVYQDRIYTISCYQLSWWERFKILIGCKLWLMQLNFGQELQPQRPTLDNPFLPLEDTDGGN